MKFPPNSMQTLHYLMILQKRQEKILVTFENCCGMWDLIPLKTPDIF